ncbi:hypothetical protein C5167_044480 [Papaver somniferum]|uniref:DUF7477 domain-containing protein n=1 Tax=Papaver somniferum TaxID=3469 RepID=A0A4Y7L8S5_PAPSO|nr:hypothetical protein C5167_044480 [Papaver somniferum]
MEYFARLANSLGVKLLAGNVLETHSMVVELDFLYSSDGTRRWWDNVYRITVVAATWDQTAFILSVPKRNRLAGKVQFGVSLMQALAVTICPDSMLEVAADLRRQVAGRLPCSLLLQVYTPFCESTYFF